MNRFKPCRLVLPAVLLLVSAARLSAFGVGLQFQGNISSDFDPGIAVTFKLESLPLIFAADWSFSSDSSEIGLAGDVWLVNPELARFSGGSFHFFAGLGFFAETAFGESRDFAFDAGLRIPLGFNLFLGGRFAEIFVQVVPSFGLEILPSLGLERPFFPLGAGARLWF